MESMLKKVGTFRAGLGLCALLAMIAGSASAAPKADNAPDDEKEVIVGDFNQPLDEAKDSSSTTNITVSDNGVKYHVLLNGGKITSVEKDGKELKKSQYRLKHGKIEILDEDGDVEKSLAIPRAPSRTPAAVGMSRVQIAPPARGGAGVTPPPAAPMPPRMIVIGKTPKVMLGVRMSNADSDVMEQLGVENGEGVVLDSVSKGLPADNAGLKAKDIIIEADGKKLEGEETLREILGTKNPGDILVVKVLRKGGQQEIKVTLDAYNPQKLGTITLDRSSPDESSKQDAEEIQIMLKDVERQVREQVQALQSQIDATDWNAVRNQVSAALGEAMKHLAEAREQAGEAGAQGMKWWQEHGKDFEMPEGWMQFTPAPAAAAPHQQEMGSKLDKLSEQLDRMNKRLDEMEKQIQKK